MSANRTEQQKLKISSLIKTSALMLTLFLSITKIPTAIASHTFGDLLIIPYFTVGGDFVTGVHLTNTSQETEIVKFRLRRGSDGASLIDTIIVLSPFDSWTGFISDATGSLRLSTSDKSCTVPEFTQGGLTASLPGEEGYIEIISMGSADSEQPIAIAALAENGVPHDCSDVRSNFLSASVKSNNETEGNSGTSIYTNARSYLNGSYFIRDSGSGLEFGNDAIHISAFSDEPMITNQEFGLVDGNTSGFDFPDLDGGGANGASRGKYDAVIRLQLQTRVIVNDWSFNPANGVSTDWVVTVPGQYLMVNPVDATDNRDIPLDGGLSLFSRDAGREISGPDFFGFNWSQTGSTTVFHWGGPLTSPVFDSDDALRFDPAEVNVSVQTGIGFGVVESNEDHEQRIYDLTDLTGDTFSVPVNGPPVLGFTAWQRTFGNADSNRGRIINHRTR